MCDRLRDDPKLGHKRDDLIPGLRTIYIRPHLIFNFGRHGDRVAFVPKTANRPSGRGCGHVARAARAIAAGRHRAASRRHQPAGAGRLRCRDRGRAGVDQPARLDLSAARHTAEFLRNAHSIPAAVEAMRQYWMPIRYARAG
jgi:hypothetical protein